MDYIDKQLFDKLDQMILLLKKIRDNTRPEPEFISSETTPILLQEYKTTCPECGMEIPDGGMGYVCSRTNCPMQPKTT
jgi:hypothetical protein